MANMPSMFPDGVGPSLTSAPSSGSGIGASVGGGAGAQPHHGLIGIVLLAAVVLLILDKAGFRFAVAVGKR